jgi:hypothetical protein
VRAVLDTTGLENGRHLVFVRGRDADGAWGAPSAAFFFLGNPAYLPLLSKSARP